MDFFVCFCGCCLQVQLEMTDFSVTPQSTPQAQDALEPGLEDIHLEGFVSE